MSMSFELISVLHEVEPLYEAAFSIDELANACGVPTLWVREHVQAGVLQAHASSGQEAELWRFDSPALLRARRLVQLEHWFEADPQLAALTADLMEELAQLRVRLAALGFAAH